MRQSLRSIRFGGGRIRRVRISASFEHFDSIYGALDSAGVVGQGQPIEGGGVVTFDSPDESMQVWQIVRRDGRRPGAQTVATAADEHLAKAVTYLRRAAEQAHTPTRGMSPRTKSRHEAVAANKPRERESNRPSGSSDSPTRPCDGTTAPIASTDCWPHRGRAGAQCWTNSPSPCTRDGTTDARRHSPLRRDTGLGLSRQLRHHPRQPSSHPVRSVPRHRQH